MDFLTFALVYIACTAVFLFVLLFGESPLFRGTPISQLHYMLTAGCCDGIEWGVGKIVYLLLMSGCYYCYQETVFQLLPNPFVGTHHMYIGTFLCALSLTMFAVACLSDPGTITKDNLAVHTALYPYDDVIWPEKDCWTCHLPRPARSKHCPVCERCIARFDHHCGWINNCVGLSNHRYFLAFLGANQLLCLYGSLLAAATLYGEVLRHGLHTASILDHGTGKVVALMSRPSKVVQWVVVMYPLPTTLSLFLLVANLLLTSFTGYQLLLLARGRTTYETFRWSDLHNAMVDEAEAGQPPRSRLRKLLDALRCRGPKIDLPNNIYHRGFWGNLMDVAFPEARLARVKKSLRSRLVENQGRGKVGSASASQEGDVDKRDSGGSKRHPSKKENSRAGGDNTGIAKQANGELLSSAHNSSAHIAKDKHA